jgi:hypothetical protein
VAVSTATSAAKAKAVRRRRYSRRDMRRVSSVSTVAACVDYRRRADRVAFGRCRGDL